MQTDTSISSVPGPERKPSTTEMDVFGLTHRGKVRQDNQDHFLVVSLNKLVQVHLSSLAGLPASMRSEDRLAVLAMVADGVGGTGRGAEASRIAVEAVTRYVTSAIDAYYTKGTSDDEGFAGELTGAVYRTHADLLEAKEADPSLGSLATTLTLFIGVWPKVYLIQVGDSRYYNLRDGELRQVTRDQTVAQELVDSGAMNAEQAARSSWANTLSSALGGSESRPVVTRFENDWRTVHLMCSDGLTKHVPDELIRERLMNMTSAKQASEALLQDALDAGGTDNITLIVGRAVPKENGL